MKSPFPLYKQVILYREMANNQTLEVVWSYGEDPTVDTLFIEGLEAFVQRFKQRMQNADHPEPPEEDHAGEQAASGVEAVAGKSDTPPEP